MSDATGFITQQRRNRRATVVILAGTFGLLFVVVNLVAVLFGAYSTSDNCTTSRTPPEVDEESCTSAFSIDWTLLAVLAALVLSYLAIAWASSSRAALSLARAKLATGPDHVELRALIEQMSIAAGIPTPRTYVIDDPAPNAFATGRNPSHAAVTVTTGLLAIMSRRELRGVLAHEIAHIRNRDIAVTTLAVLAIGAVAAIGDIALRIGAFGGLGYGTEDDRSDGRDATALLLVLSLAIYLIALPAGLLLKAALSRNREGLADASAVELTREPGGIRSALEKLEADTTIVQHPSAVTAHLWIESPLEQHHGAGMRGSFGRLFDTHPPIEERIAKLRNVEGLDPATRGPNDPSPAQPPIGPRKDRR